MVGRTLKEIESILDLSWYYKNNKLYEIVNTYDKLMKHLDKIKDAKLISVDTETTGVNICSLPWGAKDKDTCVGFSITYERNQGIYIPIQHTEFDNMPMKYIVKYLFPILSTKPSCTHNGIFDYKVFYDMGCKLNIVHDTLLLLFNIDSKVTKGSKALKNVTRLLYGHQTIEFEDIFESTKDYGMFKYVSEEVARIYACSDTDYTLQILLDNFDFLDDKQKACYMRDVSFIPLIAVAEYNGKPVDTTSLPILIEKSKQNIKNIENILFNYVGWRITGRMDSIYRFHTTSIQELVDVLYNKLEYTPVNIKNKTGYKIDKTVLKKLKDLKNKEPDEFIKSKLKGGIKDEISGKPLIKYKDIKNAGCLPAHLILALRKQYKVLTTFFLRIIGEANTSVGLYFSSISMTNTETARLVDFIQTLDSSLKYLIKVPDTSKRYMFDFDFAQIEYRVMVALAKMDRLIEKLNDPHVDFHVEVASILLRILPELVDSKTRKKFKPINFGIPYGIGIEKLIDDIFGVGLTQEEYDKAKKEVTGMLKLWMDSLHEIMSMLNSYRGIARLPREYNHPLTRNYTKTSYIQLPDGRRRIFDLKDETTQTLGKIDRMAGNTPIQGFARTIYLTSVNDLYKEFIKEGLCDTLVENKDSISGYSFTSKITIHAFIHDEIVGMADNDVNPYYLYNLIYNKCMKKLKGHPTYFCGITICNNWKEGKDGDFEAPIDYVIARKSDQKFVEPRTDWPKYVADDMTQWVNNESIKYVESICGDELTEKHILDVDKLMESWKDYYYKTKINDFGFRYKDKLVINPDVNVSQEEQKEDDDEKLVNSLVGTLVYYKYPDVSIYWKSRSYYEHVVNANFQKNEKKVREKDITDYICESIDEDTLDIDDIDLDYTFDEEYSSDEEANVDVQKNSSLLMSVLSKI